MTEENDRRSRFVGDGSEFAIGEEEGKRVMANLKKLDALLHDEAKRRKKKQEGKEDEQVEEEPQADHV
jgi:hypothetical protein